MSKEKPVNDNFTPLEVGAKLWDERGVFCGECLMCEEEDGHLMCCKEIDIDGTPIGHPVEADDFCSTGTKRKGTKKWVPDWAKDVKDRGNYKTLPCPFCGEKPLVAEGYVACTNPNCSVHLRTMYCFNNGAAVRAWNRRAK